MLYSLLVVCEILKQGASHFGTAVLGRYPTPLERPEAQWAPRQTYRGHEPEQPVR